MPTRAEMTAETMPIRTREQYAPYLEDDPQLIGRVINQLISEIPFEVITRTFSIPKIVVEQIKKDFFDIIETCKGIHKYKATRKDLLNAAEQLLLKSVTDKEVIARANLRDRAFAFKEVFAARRLEEDKSTKNVSQSISYTVVDLLPYKPK